MIAVNLLLNNTKRVRPEYYILVWQYSFIFSSQKETQSFKPTKLVNFAVHTVGKLIYKCMLYIEPIMRHEYVTGRYLINTYQLRTSDIVNVQKFHMHELIHNYKNNKKFSHQHQITPIFST